MRSFGVRLPILAATAWAGIGLSVMGRDLGYSETIYLTPTVTTLTLPTTYVSSARIWYQPLMYPRLTYQPPTAFPVISPHLTSTSPHAGVDRLCNDRLPASAEGSWAGSGSSSDLCVASLCDRLSTVQLLLPAYYTTSYRATSYTPTIYRPTVLRISPGLGNFVHDAKFVGLRAGSVRYACGGVGLPELGGGISVRVGGSSDLFGSSVEQRRHEIGSRAGRSHDPTIPSSVGPPAERTGTPQPGERSVQRPAASEKRADSPPKPPAARNENRTQSHRFSRRRCAGCRNPTPAKASPGHREAASRPAAPDGQDPAEPDLKPAPIDNDAAPTAGTRSGPIYSTPRTLRPELRNVLVGRVESDAGEPLGEVSIAVARADNGSIRRTRHDQRFWQFRDPSRPTASGPSMSECPAARSTESARSR